MPDMTYDIPLPFPGSLTARRLRVETSETGGTFTIQVRNEADTNWLGLTGAGGNTPSANALGDILYANATPAWAILPGNTTTIRKFLRQTGTGTVSAAPAWDTIIAADLPGGFSGFANPTAMVGLTAVNGVATTAMRSDAAPALNQAIAPTWTGTHTFNQDIVAHGYVAMDATFGIIWDAPTGPSITGSTQSIIITTSSGETLVIGNSGITWTDLIYATGSIRSALDGASGGFMAGATLDVQLYRDGLVAQWRTDNSLVVGGSLAVGTTTTLAKLLVYDTVTTTPRGIVIQQVSVGSDEAQLNLTKSRGGASPAVLMSDILGNVGFGGHDGTAFAYQVASIRADANENWSNTAHGSKLTFFLTPNGSTTLSLVAQMTFVSGTPYFYVGTLDASEAGLGYSVNGTGHEGISMWHDGTEGFIDSVDAGTAWHDLTIRANNIRFDLIGNADRVVFTSAGQLQLPVTGSAGGIRIGGDVNLWRDAANILRTNDNLRVDAVLYQGAGTVAYPTTPAGQAIVFKASTSDGSIAIQDGAGRLSIYWNTYFDASAVAHKYIVSSEGVNQILVNAGSFTFRTAAGGTSGNNITWTQPLLLSVSGSNATIGFLGATAAARQSVTGSRGGNAALASLLTALATFGLITDSTTA